MDRAVIAVAEYDMAKRRSCLFIQADALLVVKADMEEYGAAPAHANIDVPLAGLVLADMDVGDRPPRRPMRCQVALE